MIGTDAFQETPIVEVTRQITKHNYLVMDVRDLPRIVKEVGTGLLDGIYSLTLLELQRQMCATTVCTSAAVVPGCMWGSPGHIPC